MQQAEFEGEIQTMTGQIKKLEEVIESEYVNQIDELTLQNDELTRLNNLKTNTIEELESQIEEMRNNYLIRNDPSVSSIEFISTNTKFGQETPSIRSAAKRRPLTGFEEMYAALEHKDNIILQITNDLMAERARIKDLLEENSELHCQVKMQDTQISQLRDEITSLTQRLETLKFLS